MILASINPRFNGDLRIFKGGGEYIRCPIWGDSKIVTTKENSNINNRNFRDSVSFWKAMIEDSKS